MTEAAKNTFRFAEHGVNLAKVDDFYVVHLYPGMVVTTDKNAVLEALAVREAEYVHPFVGGSPTWTFVRYEFAHLHKHILEHIHKPSPHFTPSKDQIDVVDWITYQPKSMVVPWTVPFTEERFYLFADAQEAMLFKLNFGF